MIRSSGAEKAGGSLVVVRVVGEGGHLWIAMVLGEGCGMGEGRETGASLFGVEEEVKCGVSEVVMKPFPPECREKRSLLRRLDLSSAPWRAPSLPRWRPARRRFTSRWMSERSVVLWLAASTPDSAWTWGWVIGVPGGWCVYLPVSTAIQRTM